MRDGVAGDRSVDLDLIFGKSSVGETYTERARSSNFSYVRSQLQLALASSRATGRRLSASEALADFGISALEGVARNGSYPLISVADEPAKTFKNRRNQLNLNIRQLAQSAGVSEGRVKEMETFGVVSPVRDLEKVAQALALDERVLGFQPEAKGDSALGVRLRELADQKDVTHFSAASVLSLTEAAWVIRRQKNIAEMVGQNTDFRKKYGISPDYNYGYPTFEKGYRLAELTRDLLGIGASEPILSLRVLIEEKLGIPLVQQQLDERFAGATLANGEARGIVVNERGRNQNIWVRRMTLAHELGHLLWDPDQRLNKLVVDKYDTLDMVRVNRDPVEMRANAFAIAFLAPPSSVLDIASSLGKVEALAEIVGRFGISATAAKWHATNICSNAGLKRSFGDVKSKDLPSPTDDWVGRENLTIDWFPMEETPISRRGLFSGLVAFALKHGFISSDTAAVYLRSTSTEVEKKSDVLLDFFFPQSHV